jgi:hypothetical protein
MGFFKKIFGGGWQNQVNRRIEKQIARERAAEKNEANNAQRERHRKEKVLLRELGENYKCHECGTKAKEPYLETIKDVWADESITYQTVTDYDIPGDLFICFYCHEWTCSSRSCSMEADRNHIQDDRHGNLNEYRRKDLPDSRYGDISRICKHCAKERIK